MNGKIKVDQVLNTGLFDFEQAQQFQVGLKRCAVSISLKQKNMELVVLVMRGPILS